MLKAKAKDLTLKAKDNNTGLQYICAELGNTAVYWRIVAWIGLKSTYAGQQQ